MKFFTKILSVVAFVVLSFSSLLAKHIEPIVFETSDSILVNTTWKADTVKVVGDVVIDTGITLTIGSGTYVQFQGHYKLEVQGRLLAKGTSSRYITFTIKDTTNYSDMDTTGGGWRGIRFAHTPTSNDSSFIEYCILEYGKALKYDYYEQGYGGAVSIRGFNKIKISNSIVRHNCAISGGGGLHIGTAASVINCKIFDNHSAKAGGIYSNAGNLFGNLITENSSQKGGGVYIQSSSGNFVNNTVVNNSADYGGGIAFHYSYSNGKIVNSIIYGNSANDDGSQIYFFKSDPSFNYCDIEGDSSAFGGDSYSGDYENNIDEDPLFVNSGDDPYSLQNASPCKNSGTPDVSTLNIPEYDIIGNYRIYESHIDMGCYEIDVATGINISENTPLKFSLEQNYPNPFNPTTRIGFSLPEVSKVTIEVYNILGQKVAVLLNAKKAAGNHSLQFDASSMSAGLYLYVIRTEKFTQARKMLLVK